MLVVSQAQMMCRRRASSSSTWDSMSEREEAAAAEGAQWQTLGQLCVSACRSDGLGRMLLLVT